MTLFDRYLKEPFHDYSDVELLTLLIGGNQHQSLNTAKKLLLRFGSLKHIAQLEAQVLYRFPGVGKATAARIHAGLRAGRRALFFHHSGASIQGPEEAYQQLWPHLVGKENEELWALFLDRKKQLLLQKCMTIGNDQCTIVDPKQIYRAALLVQASGVVIGHNHPSGDIHPSEADILITRRLEQAGQLLNITLLDHLIIGNDGFCSLADIGFIKMSKRDWSRRNQSC